jgi:quercetin dioxygenase-like cupin family protein
MYQFNRSKAHLVAVVLLVTTAGSAAAQMRTELQKIEFPENYEIHSVIAELQPGQCTGRHSHPGAESAYVLEGNVVAHFDEKPDVARGPGQPLQFGSGEVHNVCNIGDVRFRALAHYIVEKGKPLVTPAP